MKITITQNLVTIESALTRKQFDLLVEANGKVSHKDSEGSDLYVLGYKAGKEGSINRHGVIFNRTGDEDKLVCSFLLEPSKASIENIKSDFGFALVGLKNAEEALASGAASMAAEIDSIFA
jgi:hypothetical protein